MRKLSKLERYIERYHGKSITNIARGARSNYYTFGYFHTIRVSDHVAFHKGCDISIVMDSHDKDHFILHGVHSGEISIVSYDEIKRVICTIQLLPGFISVMNKPEAEHQNLKEEPKVIVDPTHVFGRPIQEFSTGHQTALRGILNSHLKRMKKM